MWSCLFFKDVHGNTYLRHRLFSWTYPVSHGNKGTQHISKDVHGNNDLRHCLFSWTFPAKPPSKALQRGSPIAAPLVSNWQTSCSSTLWDLVRTLISTKKQFFTQLIPRRSFNFDLSVELIRKRTLQHASIVGGFCFLYAPQTPSHPAQLESLKWHTFVKIYWNWLSCIAIFNLFGGSRARTRKNTKQNTVFAILSCSRHQKDNL